MTTKYPGAVPYLPDRRSIETHVEHLRAFPELEATIANWWDAPATQRFVWTITQIGL